MDSETSGRKSIHLGSWSARKPVHPGCLVSQEVSTPRGLIMFRHPGSQYTEEVSTPSFRIQFPNPLIQLSVHLGSQDASPKSVHLGRRWLWELESETESMDLETRVGNLRQEVSTPMFLVDQGGSTSWKSEHLQTKTNAIKNSATSTEVSTPCAFAGSVSTPW